jgi:hypothetical protein
MQREQWIARPGVLESLAERYAFSIFASQAGQGADDT